MEEHTIKNALDTSPASCGRKSGKEKRRTSILKHAKLPKLRTPLKELHTSSQEVKDDATTRQSRRVSFGHFHIRKFGYEDGIVCDSIYSFESSTSESSRPANNSVGENDDLAAANSSSHHCKNTSPESTKCKRDPHMKANQYQNPTKHKCADTANKNNATDIGVCSLKKMAVKQIPDDSPGFSVVDNVSPRHSSVFLNSKSYSVTTHYKDNNFFERENFVRQNSVVPGEKQRVPQQDNIKQLQGLAKCSREQCEQENQVEAHNCEHHWYSATVTDMELADSCSYGNIECKEESLLCTKCMKSVETTEKSVHFTAESDMELTKAIDTFCCGEALNTTKDKRISLNNTEAKSNLLSIGDGQITNNSKDFNSMKIVSQQLNATKRFSRNNGMDITEGCGIIYCNSNSDILCQITKNSKDYNSMKSVNQQLNATKRFSTNNGMDITEGCGIIDCNSNSDIPNDSTIDIVSSQKRFSTNNGMDITEGCGIIECNSNSDIPNDSAIDVVNSRILSLSRLSMDEEDCDKNEEKTSKYSTKYLNPHESSRNSLINESMEQTLAIGCVLNESGVDYRKSVKGLQINENVSCHLEYSGDNILPVSGEKYSGVTAAMILANEDKVTDHIEKFTETKPEDTDNLNASKTILMCVDMESTQNVCQNDRDGSFMQFTRVVEANIEDNSIEDRVVPLRNNHSNHREHFNTDKKNVSYMEKSTLKYDMCSTRTENLLCDSRSTHDIVATERQTDVCATTTSSNKVSACKDQQNGNVSSHISDTKSTHPLILKLPGNEATKCVSPHTECNIQKDIFIDSFVSVLSEKTNHGSYCKERLYEETDGAISKQPECCQDRSVACNSPQTVAKNTSILPTSVLPTSTGLKAEIVRQREQDNDVGNNMCRVPSNSSIVPATVELCVTPISDTEDLPKSNDSANKIISKYLDCGNKSELQYLPTPAVEDCVATDRKSLCALGSMMSNKKRRSSEREETRGVTKIRKKQYISKDHIDDKQCSQNTMEHSGLAMETKAFFDKDAVFALSVQPGVMNTVTSERPALKIVDASSDTHSVQVNGNSTLSEKTDVTKNSLPHPPDQNTIQNFSHTAKPVVFNSPSDCGLEIIGCVTSSAAITTVDCKNKFSGSTLLTDKNNINLPLPENEVIKRNLNDGDDVERSNTCEQKKYRKDSSKANNTPGTPKNISDVDILHTSLREVKNAQHIDDSGVLQIHSAASIDGDKNSLLSATDFNDTTGVTIRRRRRFESNTDSLSFMQKSNKIGDYCTEIDKNKCNSVFISTAELSGDVNRENVLSCSFSNSEQHETASLFQPRYDEHHTSIKEGDNETVEGMEILSPPRKECSFHEADAAIHNADKTFHSWFRNTKDSIVNDGSAPSADKINSNNSSQKSFGTTKCFPARAPDVTNKAATLDYLPSRNEKMGQNVTPDISLDFKISDAYFNNEIQLAQASEKTPVVNIDSTSSYLVENREQDSFSKSCLVRACDSEHLKQSVQGNNNSNSGKEMDSQEFNDSNSIKRPNADVEVLNITSETNNLQEAEEKCPTVSSLMKVSNHCEPLQVNISCEAVASYSNTQTKLTPNIVQGFCSATNTAQGGFPVVKDTEQHTLSTHRAQVLPPVGQSARDCAAAAFSATVPPPVQCFGQYFKSVNTTRDVTSTGEYSKIRVAIDGVGDAGIASTFCTRSQNSKCDSFNNETAVHSETLHSTPLKMGNITEKQEVAVVGIHEEKLTSPEENKHKKIVNDIISKAERTEVLWSVRAFTQFQWIFTFLNDTLRLYIHFDKPAEDGIIEDVDFISYLTDKADEDAKFVHSVLLKKFAKNKLKALCKEMEHVPELLEKISVDVRQMVAFIYEFHKVQLLYNMEMFGTSVSFNIMSYKLAICFKLNIDLRNWEQIMEDNITITQKYGHVNETEVKSLANGVERNSYFLRNYFKAVQKYMKILERFGC